MTNTDENLMKHFASSLRKQATGKVGTDEPIDQSLLKYLSRKELVQILTTKHSGQLPKELNLVEMENGQLLELIGNELYILTHFTKLWCLEEPVDQIPVQKSEKVQKPTKKS